MFNFKNVEPSDINLDYIYSKVTQEEIYKFCLNSDLVFHKHILSPLRKDTRPSFSLKRTMKGDILWRDWGTGENGDAINLVEKMYGCTHMGALKIIYNNLIKGHTPKEDVRLHLKTIMKQVEKEMPTLIEAKKRPFNLVDFKYWDSFGIKLKTLNFFNVYAADTVWLNKFNYDLNEYNGWRLLKEYKKNNPVYAYTFKSYKKVTYKIYSPLDNRFKWLSNCKDTDIQGYDQLPHFGDYLILTKSLKDVMCLYEMGIPAIALQGEHNNLSQEQYEKIIRRFPKVILFYDNDSAGKKGSNNIAKRYDFREIFIPDKLGIKDISDTVKIKGFNYGKRLMKKLLKDGKEGEGSEKNKCSSS